MTDQPLPGPAAPADISIDTRRPIAIGRTAEVFELPEGRVLKLFHDWMPVGAVEREETAARLVVRFGAPAPACHGRVQIGDRAGLVYDAVRGPSMLAQLSSHPWTGKSTGRALARLQARIATVPGAELVSACDRLRESIGWATGIGEDLRAAALEALERLPDGTATCHLDFHPDNVIVTADGPMVIDWMTAARGNPNHDVARTLLLVEIGEPPQASAFFRVTSRVVRAQLRRGYLHERLRHGDVRREEIEAWRLPVAVARFGEGIKSEWPRLEALARSALAARSSR